ncbi:sortase domain-bontaining protein [Pseudonocardia acidicola]|uniref:Class F sortase n=1 Tax=Pseudonocardia acidicola TaxID=2724939 RepID=A0ABX1SEC0_9PSEU|nr:class F sortase [Pseudonocardia acidicola]
MPATPQRLRLPSLGVDAPVVPVGVAAGGALVVPDDPGVLGWWQAGARPGSGHGTVVVDGHVDSAVAGPGALYHLRAVRLGDRVQLGTDRGTQGYVVRALRSFPKSAPPPDLFAIDGPPRLALITCGGSFDRHTRQYADNVVAYAVPG